MGLNQNLEEKKGPATVFPAKKTLVKKRMLDQVVQCFASSSGRYPHCCSATSQSSKSEVPAEEVVQRPKTEK
ncbi:hypothetical protein DITRI_Ditri05aG0113200 [Diplodiscus trichospermus]